MIQGSGFGVAMINGDPVVKAHAKIVAPHHDEDGFAFIVNQMFEH
jgi:hydroxymethylpyrimidine pyrophosphatase-like HAD family hydrolase